MLTASIRNKVNGLVHPIKFVRESGGRSVRTEIRLHREAASASDHVLRVVHHGPSAPGIRYRIMEVCASSLRSHIEEGVGADDDRFWRWSSQIARAVVDIHRIGVIHLAIQARLMSRLYL